jgi:hypothetical protein
MKFNGLLVVKNLHSDTRLLVKSYCLIIHITCSVTIIITLQKEICLGRRDLKHKLFKTLIYSHIYLLLA